jgi:hypothetical protein
MNTNNTLFDVETIDNKINQIQNSLNNSNLNDCNKSIETVQQIIQELGEVEILLNVSKTNAVQLLNTFNNKKKELEELAKKQELAKKSGCKNLDELITKVENPNQVAILNRIVTDKEYSKIYLSGYEPNTETAGKKKFLIGTVKVLGTFNEKKQLREEYEIKLYKEDPKGMFWCSCADHKFNSTKKNIVCKHICFLICKIAKFLKPEIFANKKLSDEDLAQLLAKLTATGEIWKDQTVAKILDKITLETFKQFLKAIDDCCPVCFNDLTVDDKPQLLACPTCKNYIHSECADIWLEQKACCAMCKSDYWKYYGKVKSGGSVSVKNC